MSTAYAPYQQQQRAGRLVAPVLAPAHPEEDAPSGVVGFADLPTGAALTEEGATRVWGYDAAPSGARLPIVTTPGGVVLLT
jgi:hypothetical protein